MFFYIFNVLEHLTLIAFIVASICVLIRERHTRFGIVVKEGDKVICDGRQGIETSIGTGKSNDVVLKEQGASPLQAIVKYNPLKSVFEVKEYGKRKGNVLSEANSYIFANRSIRFLLPKNVENCFKYGSIINFFSNIFVIYQMNAVYEYYGINNVTIPYIIIELFLYFSKDFRADKQPVVESVLSVLLSFYIESTLYGFSAEEINTGVIKACIGVSLYIISFYGVQIFIKYGMSKSKVHSVMRAFLAVFIIGFSIVNIFLAREVNGAYNWITIGALSFQPGEVVKILYLLLMVTPTERMFLSKRNIAVTLVLTVFVLGYAFLIRDIGLLLQLAVIFAVASVVQNTSLFYLIGMLISGVIGALGVLKVSSTAALRVKGWVGQSDSILECLTGSGAFDNMFDAGYQQVKSLIAIRNAGFFGNKKHDVFAGMDAVNNDLVMAFLAQRHGSITILLIIGLYVILLMNTIFTLKQKTKTQQTLSCVAISLVLCAFVLNLAGTVSVLPLTGVVSPAISQGISSSIVYGAAFGILASSGLTKEYLEVIKAKKSNE